jgi:hypothetical protein
VLDTATVLTALPQVVDELNRTSSGATLAVDGDVTTLFDLERLELRKPLPARILTIDGTLSMQPLPAASPGGHRLLTVRRAGVLRRQFALRNDPLPDDREPVVTLRFHAEDEVALHQVRSPAELPASDLVNIALTCVRDRGWESRWRDVLGPAKHVTILIDTPFSESLAALLVGTTGFRYAIEPLFDGTALFVYVCAVDGARPLILPCTVARAAALKLHTRSRIGGQPLADLSAVVADPDAVLAVARRIVAEESVIEHHS